MTNNKENYATKEDLQAIKEDLLAKLATKEELSQQKEELLAKLATKEELSQQVAWLSKRIDSNSDAIRKLTIEVIDIKENMVTKKEFNEKFDLLLNGQDKIMQILEANSLEMKVQDLTTEKLKGQNEIQNNVLKEHDLRLKTLEENVL